MAEMATIDVLGTMHRQAFVQSLLRVIETDVAETTFAEIIDGIPTIDSYRDFHWPQDGHPATQHLDLCPGMIEKACQLRSDFPPTRLSFQLPLLRTFEETTIESRPFHLRLFELLAVSIHQIAVYLYQQDDSPRDASKWDGYRHPTAFCHSLYIEVERYLNGDADTVGYWAEAKVFGGVLVFDRGASETEGDGQASQSPLPFTATSENRWRWDIWDAMAHFHVFRDRCERSVKPTQPTGCAKSAVDWPEIADELYLIGAMHDYWDGQPVDKNEVRAALERLQQITPSSPVWPNRNAHSWTTNLLEQTL
ncbi:uncharacterized protein BKA55DRAFT_597482 [Fusarium redolens]|uniref:Uncharacterized protein n=1 Tax=Fusarium redolens TaxID=48865 RepID=A0A9P9GDP3_FUSRE|nr:uncharacterized protein BKA55DRAFT_597482 [Fusarium redolens]KAH7236976.1 hypothetical protein BKA55DRAFT_597482 [Fusarium redolens]